MKFTKEQAIQDLKARFLQKKGEPLKLSERTIGEAIDSLLQFADEETEMTAFNDKAFKVLEATNGNFIKDTADAAKAWAEAHPVPGDPNKDKPTPPVPLDMAAAMVEFQKLLSPVATELATIREEKARAAIIKSGIDTFMGKKPDKQYQKAIDKAINTAKEKVTKDDTAETVAKVIEVEYEELVAIAGGEKGYEPANPTPGGDQKTKLQGVKDYLIGEGLLPAPEVPEAPKS